MGKGTETFLLQLIPFLVIIFIPLTILLFVFVWGKAEDKVLIKSLRKTALSKLKGHWLVTIGVTLIYGFILAIILGSIQIENKYTVEVYIRIIGGLALIFISPLFIGIYYYHLELSKGRVQISNLFFHFKSYWRNLGLVLILRIFVILWSLLLIVPGIIKALSYTLTYFIRCENPELSALEAITLSRKIMHGNKKKLFKLVLSFFPLSLLSFFTLWLLDFYIIPYYNNSLVEFYKMARAEYESKTEAVTV